LVVCFSVGSGGGGGSDGGGDGDGLSDGLSGGGVVEPIPKQDYKRLILLI
jgi:hypothetical protein